jgi:FkbM family methyltransferase
MDLNPRLIIDIGVSEGEDSAFYLAKGFDVVGVEADATVQARLAARFGAEIADGRFRLLHRAAAARGGEWLAFFHDEARQSHSSLSPSGRDPGRAAEVFSIDWLELREVAGVPYYLKLDIEGGEPAFLSSMAIGGALPPFVSAEVPTFRPVAQLFDLGYRHFRLINHEILNRLTLPDPALEGSFVARPDPQHWSGPFGRELPGKRWYDFQEIRGIYEDMHRLWEMETLIVGWLDCHAARPDALG